MMLMLQLRKKKNRKWLPEGQVTHWWQSQESNPGSLTPQTLPSFQAGMFWGQSLTFGVDALLIQCTSNSNVSAQTPFPICIHPSGFKHYLFHYGGIYSLVLCYCGLWFTVEVSTCKEVRRWIQNQKQFSWINKVLLYSTENYVFSILW